MLELPFYLVAAWLLIRSRGIEGAAVAWAGRTAVDLALYLGAARRVLPESGPPVRGVWLGVAAAVAALAAAAAPTTTAGRAAVAAVAAAAFAAAAWTRLLTAAERASAVAGLKALCDRVTPGAGGVAVDAAGGNER